MTNYGYEVSVKTHGGYNEASTGSLVQFQFVGIGGEMTDWLTLNQFLQILFQKGQKNDFTLHAKDVGLPLILKIKLFNLFQNDAWGCDYIEVKYKDQMEVFPLYDWVTEEIAITASKAMLPQKVSNERIKDLRKHEVEKSKVKYPWVEKGRPGEKNWILPRYLKANHYNELPPIFKQEDIRKQHSDWKSQVVALNAVIETAQAVFHGLNEFDDFKKIFDHADISEELPPFILKWQEDAEMGRQILNGTNPSVIARCKKLPEHCNITDEDVGSLLKSGKTLQQEMASGKIYILDHSMDTEGVMRNKQGSGQPIYCPDAMALFYSPGDGQLLPIAIQLEPRNREYIFTPKDTKEDWLLAKMYFRCCHSNIHEWDTHFLLTHDVMEPICVSVFRCLSRSHPIYKLLRPHLKTVIAINQSARDGLIYTGSSANLALGINGAEQAKKIFEHTFDFNELNIPEKLKKKDVLDRKLLPGYHYRDDALLLWDVVSNYVTSVVKHYYTSNKDITEDFELQDWIKEIAYEGFGWADNNPRGCPSSFSTVDELISFCVITVFTSSVQHAAVNFGQFDLYKFIPNSPTGMRLPIHKKGEATHQRIMDSLPDIIMATLQLGITFVLSQFTPDEIYLGQFPSKFFNDPEITAIQEKLSEELKAVGDKIKKRNEGLEFPYEYLLPEKIPASIAV